MATAAGVSATISAITNVIAGERDPKVLIGKAVVSAALTATTFGIVNGISTHVTNVFIRSVSQGAVAGLIAFSQNVIEQGIFNGPNEPIDYDRALAVGIVAAAFATLGGLSAGDRYDGGSAEDDAARKLYDLTVAIGSQGFGIAVDALYPLALELYHELRK